MIRNYFTIAWRSLLRNKLYSSINVVGLSIGISACMVIFLIVNFEFSFDKFHQDGDRIYRVYSKFHGAYNLINHGISAGIPGSVRNQISGIERQAAFHTFNAAVKIENGNGEPKVFEDQNRIIITEPDYFKVFSSYQWLIGSPSASLEKPFQVVLTESKAKTYFGVKDALQTIGREIVYRDSLIVTVSGIVKDFNQNTDFDFSDFISSSTINQSWLKTNIQLDDWQGTSSSSQFWIKLSPGIVPQQIEAGLLKLAEMHKKKDPEVNENVTYLLQRLSDLHYNSEVGIFDQSRSPAHIPTLQILVMIAVMLLVIASANFINLETAQSIHRAKEVGLRKVMGCSRAQMILLFLGQSLLMTAFAIVISLSLTEFSLSIFRDFIPPGVKLDLTDPLTLAFLLVFLVLVSLLAGFYPAFTLSSFLPVQALKNQVMTYHRSQTGAVRKGLIMFQFTFSQVLIVATLIATEQIKYMLDQDLGFAKDAILYIDTPLWEEERKVQVLKNELAQMPEIEKYTVCDDPPATDGLRSSIFKYNTGKEELQHSVYHKFGDTSYLHVFKLKLLAGRNLQKSDSVKEFIINETYARMLGFTRPAEALGKEVEMNGKKVPIIGVVKDFHIQSLHFPLQPVAIADNGIHFGCLGIKLTRIGTGADLHIVIDKMEKAWKKVYDQKFEYHFLDETIANFYEKEQRTSKLVETATAVAVLISFLGLFGLASLTTAQRTKEIGIRKVLGATKQNIVALLSKEFLRLVLVAFVIAAPAAYYLSNLWLVNFAYRISIGWTVFAWTILATAVITILSVSYQALKAATADPVESLRYE